MQEPQTPLPLPKARTNERVSISRRHLFDGGPLETIGHSHRRDGPFPHGTRTTEFQYIIKFGMTPAQVIRAATIVAAQQMGWEADVDSIERVNFAMKEVR